MPAKLAGYFKRNKETSAKLREIIMRPKKSTRKTSPPSAEGLSLMKEKEAKENQGIRDACQVGWVP